MGLEDNFIPEEDEGNKKNEGNEKKEIQDIKELKITSIESWGLFLEDGGFVHICKISDFHNKSALEVGELNNLYPVGITIRVQLEKEEKLLNEKKGILYNFLGPVDEVSTQER